MRSLISPRAALMVAFCALNSGCVLRNRGASDNDASVAQHGNATVVVRNHNFNDVTVYAVGSAGARTRLGTVTGESTATFTLPSWTTTTGTVGLIADPIGGNGLARSGPVPISPGRVVTFTIEQNLALSAAIVH
jgi:hypothetical protein